jgi:DNA-binding CsgD family transcriptional regulator
MELLNLDHIYECAFIAEGWPSVLGQLADLTGAVGGGIFMLNGDLENWTASQGLAETMSAFVKGRILHQMNRPTRVDAVGQHSFITEADAFKLEELDDHPLYRDFLRPRGLGWSARTSVRLPTGDSIILTMERAQAAGPIPPESLIGINALRPHLARAAFISARMRLENAKTATQTLAMLGLPALVLNQNGRVIAANRLIENLKDTLVYRAQDRVALTDIRADQLLSQAIINAADDEFAVPYSFSVSNVAGQASMVAHVIPVRGQSRDVFLRSAAVLILTPVSSPTMPNVDVVQSLFDLTPAEAKVARFIAQGETVEDIAATNSVSINTVRAQMRGVLEKTGCTRQVEVANLLSGISVIREVPKENLTA